MKLLYQRHFSRLQRFRCYTSLAKAAVKSLFVSFLLLKGAGGGQLAAQSVGDVTFGGDYDTIGGDLMIGSGTMAGWMSVTGAGSSWTDLTSDLYIGYSSDGTLTITGGGKVTNRSGTIGDLAGSTGMVTVTGVNSTWINSADLMIGNYGMGTLTISDGGEVIATSVTVGYGAQGVINIGAASGSAAAAAGKLTTSTVTLGLQGSLYFNHTGTGYIFASQITGTGSLTQAAGTTILTADNSYSGGTTISGGTLQIGNGGTTGSITGNVVNNSILSFNRTGTLTFGGIISGSGAVTSTGTGTIVLTGANAYSGGTTISGGVLQISADNNLGAVSGLLTLSGGGTLATTANISMIRNVTLGTGGGLLNVASGTTLTMNGVISGAGLLTKTNTGTLVLTNANTYSGGTTISGGTLQIGNGGTTGSITGNVANTGTLAFNRSNTLTFGGVISGSGSMEQIGSSTLVLTGASTYTGGTTIALGSTLQLGSGGTAGSIAGNVTNNGTLTFNRSNGWTFGGAISGTGAVNQIGAGTTILTGNNNYAGGTTISAGTLQIGAGGTIGSITGNVVNNSILAFNRSDAWTFGGVISGTGAVTQISSGTAILTATNTYTGTTTIGSGTLALSGGGSIASSAEIVNNSKFDITNTTTGAAIKSLSGMGTVLLGDKTLTLTDAGSTGSGSFGGTISGSTLSNVIVTGGTQILTGVSNAFGGTVTVTGATSGLRVNGTLGSSGIAVNVNSGGSFGGNGIVNGNVTITNGILSVGASGAAGTLTINGNLTLNSTSTMNYSFGQPDVANGTLNDLVQVNGNLTLAGTLNVATVDGTLGLGIYRLFNYTGTLTGDNDTVTFGTLPTTTGSYYIVTSTNGQVDLLNTDNLTLKNFWNATGIPGSIVGGSGTWDTTTANWTNVLADPNVVYQNSIFAIFGGTTSGTVTIDGNVLSSGMQFAVSGYTITDGTITLVAGSNAIRVGDGSPYAASYVGTIDSELIGTGGIDKCDLGTLILTGDNTYTGGTIISKGALHLGNNGTTGSIINDITNNSILAFNRSDTYTFIYGITGTGSVYQIGNGTTVLTGTSNYTGNTYVQKGVLTIAGGGDATDANAYIADLAGSAATVNVNGSGGGGKWKHTGELFVGYRGAGTLNVTNGGEVSNTNAYLGNFAGSSGIATVTGANSKWTSTGTLNVGQAGNGTLNILDGGLVSANTTVIGRTGATMAVITIEGTNSKLTNAATLYVGYSANGSLTITNGGSASNAAATIGFSAGVTGRVTVDGTGNGA
ncbi:MAG: autotransporter-associated beta strand repeat-containing protein, partial [Phycisphaerales bacterium]|nr:autotransporter-associated beta strand repeat-containing protein [Phycisphaerales bacterium]